jgi:hypothetical protein
MVIGEAFFSSKRTKAIPAKRGSARHRKAFYLTSLGEFGHKI